MEQVADLRDRSRYWGVIDFNKDENSLLNKITLTKDAADNGHSNMTAHVLIHHIKTRIIQTGWQTYLLKKVTDY